MTDRYGRDVLRDDPHTARVVTPAEVPAAVGLVVECRSSGFCGAVIGLTKTSVGVAVELENRKGARRLFPLTGGAFLLDGRVVTLVRPAATTAPATVGRSASGSRAVPAEPARVARASRIWVEGIHDAELVERIWGHDLRIEGVVVEPLHGADHLLDRLAAFDPAPDRRVGVLLDHLTPGSKESRLADDVLATFTDVLIVGHPFVDVWQAVRPVSVGIPAWPVVPPGTAWKQGVVEALGWSGDERAAWRRILACVRDYRDLEPAMLGPVEQLIDFVTVP